MKVIRKQTTLCTIQTITYLRGLSWEKLFDNTQQQQQKHIKLNLVKTKFRWHANKTLCQLTNTHKIIS